MKHHINQLLLLLSLLFCSIQFFVCNRNMAEPSSELVTSYFSSDSICVYSKEEILSLKLKYTMPDLILPTLLYQDKNDSTQNLNVANFVAVNRLNRKAISEIGKSVSRSSNIKCITSVEAIIQVGDYLVAKTGTVYNDQDLMLWKIKNDKFELLNIYPSAVAIILYWTPEFTYCNNDTLVVGLETKDDGDIYGYYDYVIVDNDSLHVFCERRISGNYPDIIYEWASNPIHGATCKQFLDIYYNYQNIETHTVVEYDCRDEDGNTIYVNAPSGELILYHMSNRGTPSKLSHTVAVPKNSYFRIGNIYSSLGIPYIAIEYESNWYWTLKELVNLE